ncbi:competence type IV pilus minor pilin ComGD [Salirhabdus salicampi]|uniref:competence type IV pilus minor pilin ComGD n=1 Tax=Salirhabdus salicampi TaxID=476102 RepID=UPI0020C57AAD|nr:competence type IV pilus minor pilin ComGD [Salirhabdus salicampi]MCP8616848.1 hypothetical protein [Salirhabdus salicampi]
MLKLRNKGYTALEVLLVLSTVLVLISITIPLTNTTKEKQDIEHFFRVFEMDILYMQAVAVSKGPQLALFLYPDEHKYEIRKGPFFEPYVTREYSHAIDISIGTFQNPFSFKRSGVPNKPGSFYVNIDNKRYRVTFPFGKGRFYVSQTK